VFLQDAAAGSRISGNEVLLLEASDIQSVDDELHVADDSSWDGVVEHPSGLA
jgi:hypothetical protein